MNVRVNDLITDITSAVPLRQFEGLEKFNNYLSFSHEDEIFGRTFPVNDIVFCLLKVLEDPDKPTEMAGRKLAKPRRRHSNPRVTPPDAQSRLVLAARCLFYLVEASPNITMRAISSLKEINPWRVLMDRLEMLESMDVAEQILALLDSMTKNHEDERVTALANQKLLENDCLYVICSYINFYSLLTQKQVLRICQQHILHVQSLKAFGEHVVKALPCFIELMIHPDPEIAQAIAICWRCMELRCTSLVASDNDRQPQLETLLSEEFMTQLCMMDPEMKWPVYGQYFSLILSGVGVSKQIVQMFLRLGGLDWIVKVFDHVAKVDMAHWVAEFEVHKAGVRATVALVRGILQWNVTGVSGFGEFAEAFKKHLNALLLGVCQSCFTLGNESFQDTEIPGEIPHVTTETTAKLSATKGKCWNSVMALLKIAKTWDFSLKKEAIAAVCQMIPEFQGPLGEKLIEALSELPSIEDAREVFVEHGLVSGPIKVRTVAQLERALDGHWNAAVLEQSQIWESFEPRNLQRLNATRLKKLIKSFVTLIEADASANFPTDLVDTGTVLMNTRNLIQKVLNSPSPVLKELDATRYMLTKSPLDSLQFLVSKLAIRCVEDEGERELLYQMYLAEERLAAEERSQPAHPCKRRRAETGGSDMVWVETESTQAEASKKQFLGVPKAFQVTIDPMEPVQALVGFLKSRVPLRRAGKKNKTRWEEWNIKLNVVLYFGGVRLNPTFPILLELGRAFQEREVSLQSAFDSMQTGVQLTWKLERVAENLPARLAHRRQWQPTPEGSTPPIEMPSAPRQWGTPLLHKLLGFLRGLYLIVEALHPQLRDTFMSDRLTSRFLNQLMDPFPLYAKCWPGWFTSVVLENFFLFGWDFRKALFSAKYMSIPRYLNFASAVPTQHLPLFAMFSSRPSREKMRSNQFYRTRYTVSLSNQIRQAFDSNTPFGLRDVHRQFPLNKLKIKLNREDCLRTAKMVWTRPEFRQAIFEASFENEVGTGSGPTAEFFALVAEGIKECAIFREPNEGFYFPNSHGTEELMKETFHLLGIYMGKALLDCRLFDVPLHPCFWKKVQALNNPNLPRMPKSRKLEVNLQKLEEVDPQMARGLRTLWSVPDLSDLGLEFSGRPVSPENLERYVLAQVRGALESPMIDLAAAQFLEGLKQMLPAQVFNLWTAEELSVLCVGSSAANDSLWTYARLMAEICPKHGYSEDSREFLWFIQVLTELTQADRRAFIQYCTGSPNLPAKGFLGLSPPFTVVRKEIEDSNEEILPSVMTCANYLKLPNYSTIAKLKAKLLVAIYEGQSGFLMS